LEIGNYSLILNPNAGRGKGKRLLGRIEQALRAQEIVFDVHETTGPGHATELAKAAVQSGATCIIAAGGDGTVREVLNGMVGTDVVMGIVPAGSGNDFCKSVNIPTGLEAAAHTIRRGKIREVDVGRIVHRSLGSPSAGTGAGAYFANAISIGFDALATAEANRMRWLRGLPLYLGSVFKAMVSYDCPCTVIELDDRRLEQSILLTACANGQYYGGGFHIAPEAVVDDGLFDVCVIDHVSRLRILEKLIHVIQGTHAKLPEVKFYRSRKVKFSSPGVLYVQADGDLMPELDPHQIGVELVPRALKLLVPRR
jgi:YegS/Rv2252/BmrU family lipid kinase